MKTAALLFAGSLGIDTGVGSVPPNMLVASNASRFNDAQLSTPLTSYAVGYKDPINLIGLLEQIAPAVPVSPRFSFKKATNAEAFLSETDDVRALGADFKTITLTGEVVDSRTHNKGLTLVLDKDEHDTSNLEPYVAHIRRRLAMNELRRLFAVLDAAGNNTAKTWSSGSPTPVKDMRDAIETSGNKLGIAPNIGVVGGTAWNRYQDALDASSSQLAAARSMRGLAGLSEELMLDAIVPVNARFQTSLTATTKTKVAGGKIYFYYSEQGAMKDDPTAVKRFVSRTTSGTQFSVFVVDSAKRVEVTVEHSSNIIATSSGIEILTIS